MKEKIKTLQLIHLAITLGLVLSYVFAGNIKSIADLKIPEIDNSTMLFALIPIIAIFISYYYFKQMISKVKNDSNKKIEDKMAIYQVSSIIRWSILEGAGFVLLFLKPEFKIFGIIIIIYLIFIRPTENGINNELQ